MYEGKQEGDDPKGGAIDDSSEDIIRHVSPGRTSLGMDTSEGPATSEQRQEVGTVDNRASHGLEQQEMTPEVDALKREEGQLRLKSEMKSSSNLVK